MKVAITHSNDDVILLLSDLLSKMGHQLIWSANDGKSTLVKVKKQLPDLILIQLQLTDMPTAGVIKQIMEGQQTTIIAIAPSIKQHPSKVFEAMSAGALDAFSEPSIDNPETIAELNKKIRNINLLHKSANSTAKQSSIFITKNLPLVAIGSSTGGPAALVKILSVIKPDTHATFVIIQHMDEQFSHGMVW